MGEYQALLTEGGRDPETLAISASHEGPGQKGDMACAIEDTGKSRESQTVMAPIPIHFSQEALEPVRRLLNARKNDLG